MKISGFTMVRNAEKYYFPIKESIESILPIVDEFIVALGNNDPDDNTRTIIESIDSDKVIIIDRVWSEQEFMDGKIFASETNFALSQCTGDWCFYLQADEVVHENDLAPIVNYCKQYLKNPDVDGFLFNYHHFFGDYKHYLPVHGWYKNEIRIVRNHAHIYSYKDAQSFRKMENKKLNVIEIEPYIYHYGWVRPPELMQSKKKEQDSMHHGIAKTKQAYQLKSDEFDYGPLGKIPLFKGKHPAIMAAFIANIHWQNKLNYSKKGNLERPQLKHEKIKYKLLTFFENLLNGGKDFFGYSNWVILTKKDN
ncbi:glycosyltransferase [Aureispira anguillae]|uniref:Glycosyltransferase n=1 Tax=Aureispira anguillae TaxID=2864201 RepID=A0A916DSX0_9BACT|nr:glycosyltransferase [Aureispira anguillae]BDS11425.1 glycosyltransferase [Aureispira anguillae]